MQTFFGSLYDNYSNVAKLTIFNYFKTDNTVLDALISTIAISIFGIIINFISDNSIANKLEYFSLKDIKSIFYKKQISFWDIRSGLCVSTLYGHLNSVNKVRFSLKGDLVASCDSDGIVKVWDTRMVKEK